MADAEADWSSNANDAVHISLVQPADGSSKTIHSFNPKMTYSIFGDEETIFGYQGLKINLRFNACDMRPGLQINYTKRFKPVGETEPTDLKTILEQYLPKTALEKTAVFDAHISEPTLANWKPPGQLWKTFDEGGEAYEIYQGSLTDLAVQQVVKRIQILVPFFIEGGTCIELRDPEWSLERWTVFFLYQKKTSAADSNISPYIFMGYSTIYRYFYYQPITPPSSPPKKQCTEEGASADFELPVEEVKFSSLPCRSRVSQFVILPPFQGGGNGARFYNAIFEFYLKEPQTIEITVEDPNEAFDDLRDLNDLARLRTDPEFTALRINTSIKPHRKGPISKDIVGIATLDKLRRKYKIAPRQFARVVEMQLLSLIPTSIRQSLLLEKPKSSVPDLRLREHEYHLWQLWVKTRLYRHNKDTLMQLDRAERIEKLDQALSGVEADYARLLRKFELRHDDVTDSAVSASGGSKRPSPPDDDMEDDEPSTKKVKFSA